MNPTKIEQLLGRGVKSSSLEMTIIRADGTQEPLGVVSYYHANPLKQWAWNIKQFFKRLAS